MSQDSARGDARRRELERLQRRRLWLGVLLPFLVALGICIAILGVALSLRQPAQVTLMADSALTVLALIPISLCLFPVVLLSVALVALAGRWQARSRSPLRRLESWTAAMEKNVEVWLGGADERVLNWAVKAAPVRQLLSAFDQPAADAQEEEDE